MKDIISIRGAKENNLKNIDLDISKNKLVVLTGVSGSGKSTIAFDTLQTECQRQYMESLGMVTDEFVKPKVDSIVGLSPAISVTQNNANKNPRSTVGTVTEIYTYLRILYAKLGVRHCIHCGKIVYPNFEVNEEEYKQELEIEEEISNIDEYMKCPHCNKYITVLTMGHFSFNKPQGACSTCNGLGVVSTPNLEKIFNWKLSILEGAIVGWDNFYINRYGESIENAGKYYKFEVDLKRPLEEWNEEAKIFLFYGALSEQFIKFYPNVKPPKTVAEGRFEGVITNFVRRYSEAAKGSKAHENLKKLFHEGTCPTCKGNRLKKESMEVTLGGLNIVDISKMSLKDLNNFIVKVEAELTDAGKIIVRPIIEDIKERLKRYIEVGVKYLSLDRSAISLSGGEAQRLRLASLLGSGLTGVLYVLDEPTTGLHSKDTSSLIKVLRNLRDLGNTVLVIEHDLDFIKEADYIIDIGPGAGTYGGTVAATGTLEELKANENSLIGKYLSGKLKAYVPSKVRKETDEKLEIINADIHNLQNINVSIPLNKLVVVSGVSGSGKSSLIFDVLAEAAQKHLGESEVNFGNTKIIGLDFFERLVIVNQNTIGRSSRSNVATYTELYNDIRLFYAFLPEAKKKHLEPKHFSFNVSGGRCEKCEGAGILSIPMHFMPDAKVTCPVCHGKRFKRNILEVKYNSYCISDILNATVDEAIEIFKNEENIYKRLKLLKKVGLGYIKLGQETSSLSGGEAQRIKLAKELFNNHNNTLYLLDEPTTGLHPDDIVKLARLLDEIVYSGNSVVVIEHNLDIIAMADYIIDFGPGGGDEGGAIVAEGTPSQIMNNKASLTGRCLNSVQGIYL